VTRTRWMAVAVLAALVAAAWATSGLPPPTPTPPGAFAFAALGDAPYYPWEELRYRLVIRSMNDHDLALVLHVGDIFWRPCTDRHYRAALGRMNQVRHPVVYTPGDNEWTDCWEPGSGSFQPRERLDSLRKIFFPDPTRALGGRPLALATQAASPAYATFVEHARWTIGGVVFATVHLVGNGNGLDPRPNREPADDEEVRARTGAAAAWIAEAFAEASASDAPAVVIAFHGAPDFRRRAEHPERQAYEPFLETLEVEAERFGRPVLIIHGDDHEYTVDRPLVRRTTGRRLDNLTRLEVPGSPLVGWVRVVFMRGADPPFAFQPLVVPGWKYW